MVIGKGQLTHDLVAASAKRIEEARRTSDACHGDHAMTGGSGSVEQHEPSVMTRHAEHRHAIEGGRHAFDIFIRPWDQDAVR
jgi:hypothetical protein